VSRGRRVNRRLVRREIIRLLDIAYDASTPIEYADRYVGLARSFSMKYRVRIPGLYKLFICRSCKRVLRPGSTAVFRVRNKPSLHIYVKCLRCGRVYRKFLG